MANKIEMTKMGTKTGIIVKLMPDGYGFITPDTPEREPQNIFFHRVGVVRPANFDELREGLHVSFLEVEDSQGRRRAIGVVVE